MNENLQRVSDKIIHFHRLRYEESISPMKLQKLCYYSQGFYLALNENTPLFESDFQAWQHGPVIKELYDVYKQFGWKPIDTAINDIKLDEKEDEFLNEIVSSFGSYDGATLSAMTHSESPWIEARLNLSESEPSTNCISKDTIYSYFKRQI